MIGNPGTDTIRVLVCGDRKYSNYMMIQAMLDGLLINYPNMTLIEGRAPGADMIAHEWGLVNLDKSRHLTFPADWKKHGKAAGPIRNIKMLKDGQPNLVLAFHNDIANSRGTLHMVKIAKEAGLPVHLISKQNEVGV